MTGYFVSFPPLIALVGLLGILMGEQAVGLAKRHLAPSAQTSTGEVRASSS